MAQPPKFDGTLLWAVFRYDLETIADADILGAPGEIRIFDNHVAGPGDQWAYMECRKARSMRKTFRLWRTI